MGTSCIRDMPHSIPTSLFPKLSMGSFKRDTQGLRSLVRNAQTLMLPRTMPDDQDFNRTVLYAILNEVRGDDGQFPDPAAD